MPFGIGTSRRKRNSNYVPPPVQVSGFAQSAASHVTGGPSRSSSLTSLSGAAAAAALRNSGNGGAAGRSNSLSSRNFRTSSLQARSNSMSRFRPQGAAQPHSRTSSLTSASSQQRQHHHDAGIASTTVTTMRGRDPNTTIRISKELDHEGRTRSLTKETITKMGSFEVVKTTTIKPPPVNVHAPPAPSAYYTGSVLSAGDSELDRIAEEFDMDYYVEQSEIPEEPEAAAEAEAEPFAELLPQSLPQQQAQAPAAAPEGLGISSPSGTDEGARSGRHAYRQLTQSNMTRFNGSVSPVRSILKNKSPPLESRDVFVKPKKVHRKRPPQTAGDDASDSGDSVYSDAFDLMPSSANRHGARKSIMKNSDQVSDASSASVPKHTARRDSITSSTRKSVRIEAPSATTSPRVPQNGFGAAKRPVAHQKPELTPEQLYLKALEVARTRVYGDRDVEDEDEGYASDSSYRREYSSPKQTEHRFTLRDAPDRHSSLTNQSLQGFRTMSMTSGGGGVPAAQGRTMSLTSGMTLHSQQVPGPGFKTHSMRDDPDPAVKKNRLSSLGRKPSSATSKVDKKADKAARKEYMKALKQERKDAVQLATQNVVVANANANSNANVNANANACAHAEQPVAPVAAEPPQEHTPQPHSKSRFSLFGKKSSKQKTVAPKSEPIVVPDQGQNDAAATQHSIHAAVRESIQNTPVKTVSRQAGRGDPQGFRSVPFEHTSPGKLPRQMPVQVDEPQDELQFSDARDYAADAGLESPDGSAVHTPTLSLSNHQMDENSSEPKTLEEEHAAAHAGEPKDLKYEPYDVINKHVTDFSRSPRRAGEAYYSGAPAAVETAAPVAKQKQHKKTKKSFGKKVLGWFDLDD